MPGGEASLRRRGRAIGASLSALAAFSADLQPAPDPSYLHTSGPYARQLAPDLAYRLADAGVLAPRQR